MLVLLVLWWHNVFRLSVHPCILPFFLFSGMWYLSLREFQLGLLDTTIRWVILVSVSLRSVNLDYSSNIYPSICPELGSMAADLASFFLVSQVLLTFVVQGGHRQHMQPGWGIQEQLNYLPAQSHLIVLSISTLLRMRPQLPMEKKRKSGKKGLNLL